MVTKDALPTRSRIGDDQGACRRSARQDGPIRCEHSGIEPRQPQIATEERARVSPRSPLLLARVAAHRCANGMHASSARQQPNPPMEIARSG